MIARHSEKTLQQSQEFASHSFGIKESGLAHIFNVLRNQLYSNKVLAVVREYSCNAFDAHIETGKKDTPIKVTVPNILCSYFKVRDYGRGLTEKEIAEIYAMYGESTKRGTNEQIGQLGLGCKSAFAYGDNFVIHSFVDGTETTYNAFIDPSEIGTISKMEEKKTNQENGIEIIIPVKKDDYKEFIDTVTDFFKYWEVLPKFEGISDEHLKNMVLDKSIETDDWFVDNTSNDSHAIMGNISYPISNYNLNLDYSDPICKLLSAGIIINFKIGDLDISASREQLQYSESTKDTLLKRAKGIVDELPDVMSDVFASCKTFYEAKSMYSKVFTSGGALYDLKDVVSSTGIYWTAPDGQKRKVKNGHFDGAKFKPEQIKIWTFRKPDRWSRGKRVKGVEANAIVAEDKAIIIEDDSPTHNGRLNRIAPLIEDYANQPKDCEKHEIVYLIKYGSDADKKSFKDDRGFDYPAKKLTSYPKIVLRDIYPSNSTVSGGSSYVKNSKHSTKVFTVNRDCSIDSTYHTPRSDCFITSEVDFKNDSGVYVKIDRFFVCPKLKEGTTILEQHPVNMISLIKRLEGIGMKVPEVYAIKEQKLDKLKGEDNFKDNWVDIHSWARERVISQLKAKNILQKCADEFYRNLYENYFTRECDWAEEVMKSENGKNRKKLAGFIVCADSPLRILLDACDEMDSKSGEALKTDTHDSFHNHSKPKDAILQSVYYGLGCVKTLFPFGDIDQNRYNYNSSSDRRKKLKKSIEVGKKVFGVEPSHEIISITESVEDRYRMIKHIDEQNFFTYKWEDTFSKELANYINIIDATFITKKKA